MKQLILAGCALLMFSCAEESKPTPTTLSGTITGSEVATVKIFGNDFEANLDVTEGTFADTLDIEKADYYTLRIGREGTSMYLEPGSQIDLTVNTTEFDETITYTGNNSEASNYMAAKYLQSEKEQEFAAVFSMSENDFLAENQSYTDAYVALLEGTKGLDPAFVEIERKEIEYAHYANIERYQEYYRYLGKTPESKKYVVSEGFYKDLEGINFADTTAFRTSSAYRSLLGAHFSRKMEERMDADENAHPALTYIAVVNEALTNGHAKEEVLARYLRFGLKPDANLEDVAAAFLATGPSEENLALFTERYELYKTIVPGKDSPDFDYENHAGGNTALADLEGKYVYVDVWATWCGPCIREIPSLKQLEADYHEQNIAFVSISIDVAKDYEKWNKMVNEKELGGIQLFADKNWESDFVTGYGIKGIPRFIVIGPDGKIVDADAARPSNPDIRKLFDELI